MPRLNNFSKKHKHELIFFVAFFITVFLVEVIVFNRGFLFTKVLNLEERHYSVNEGNLYQFNLTNGKLVAQNNDPNITFDNINLPVGTISIKCINSVPGAVGQVFYRNFNESFNELQSVPYDASLANKTLLLNQIFGFPKVVTVSSLRFDLTQTPGDIISCDEFVINPHIPLDLSLVRLAIYVGLLLVAILYIFRNVKPDIFHKVFFVSIFLALSFILGAKLMPLAISQNIIIILVLCILLFSAGVTYALEYLIFVSKSLQDEKKGILRRYKYEIALAIVLIITTLPLLTESYFYCDDWWSIGNKAVLTSQSLFIFGRPIQFLIVAVFDKINIRDAYVFKWIFLSAIILYTILLYRWLSNKTQNKNLSFFLAGILSLFAPVMDLLGYTATGAFTFSLLFSSLSVVCFDQAYASYKQREIGKSLYYAAITFMMIFTACLAYQIGPQIVFLFLTIDLYFTLKQNYSLKKSFSFLLVFAFSNVFYLLFIKLINHLHSVEITTNRSQIIHSIAQIFEKSRFYESVIRQSIMQIETALTGNGLILERYHGYFISFTNHLAGNAIFYFVIIMILIAFIGYWRRTKCFVGLIILIIYVPMSYYAFLVLSENGYLTYYAFAHISIFMFYFLMGLITTINFIWRLLVFYNKKISNTRNIKPSAIIAPLLIVCALISNYYIRDFYINYNSSVYNFVKYSIQTTIESGNLNRIHVNGKISPINADVYSRFVVETALKDLGENVNDYIITYSGNRFFLTMIPEEEYLRILERISEEDKLELDKIYAFGSTYRQYYIKTWPSADDQKVLQRIFIQAGAIPQSNSTDTLLIDLTWTDQAYYNH